MNAYNTDPNHVRIFDTTLRDGEQSPGASLNHQQKVEIARQLESLGVDVIEAGFPITSDGDFEAVKAIGKDLMKSTVTGLARCVDRDIDRAAEALKNANRPRIHVFCATSKIHLEHKFRKPFDQIVEMSVKGVERARRYVDDVEFSPEDGSRTDLDDLVTITRAVIEAGATTINIPDTVGYSTPEEYGRIFAYVREKLPEIGARGIVLSSHCHNDLGLAVANSLAAVQNGCRQVECTVNGIGERAGNASLEEIVMAIRTRADFFTAANGGRPLSTGIDTTRIYHTSRMVSNMTGLGVQRNKAIVGENAFAHEAGIHQDGLLKHRDTYEIMDPRDIGVPESKLVLGKHSGRHALADRLEQLGYRLDSEALQQVYDRFKELADKKKDVYDEDIEAIVDALLESANELWSVARLQVTCGSDVLDTATVVLRDSNGESITAAAVGNGPIDAIYTAIRNITQIPVSLLDYQTRSITGGKDAQGEVTVTVDHSGQRVRGRGLSTDVIEASAIAFVHAINRIRTIEARKVRATMTEDAETEVAKAQSP